MAIDKELLESIELMKAGKEEGFNTFYMYTYNYVYSRAKLIMKNEEDALDLTQETFLHAYKGIASLQNVENVYAWLGGIAYRQGMQIFRKKDDVLLDKKTEGIFEDMVSEDRDFKPEETAEIKVVAGMITDLIDGLPELQKATVMAFYFDNMKIREIAEMFDCPVNTVKSRLYYAKKRLRKEMEDKERKNGCSVHILSPVVLYFACKYLLAKEEYVLAGETVQNVYRSTYIQLAA